MKTIGATVCHYFARSPNRRYFRSRTVCSDMPRRDARSLPSAAREEKRRLVIRLRLRTGFVALLLVLFGCHAEHSTSPTMGAGVSSSIILLSGSGQTALGGAPLPLPMRFRVADRGGNGVVGAQVVFEVAAGEGMLTSPISVTTSADGVAVAPSWTLGRIAILQQLRATSGALTTTASATVRTQFHADVRIVGAAVDSTLRAAVARAAARLSAEVIGVFEPTSLVNADLSGCGISGVTPLNETVASLVIYVAAVSSDGLSGLIARSGPCYVRASGGLTVVGVITLNAAALPILESQGQLGNVVLHEMHHVLGYGTLWNSVTPALVVNAGTAASAYVGTQGILGCLADGGTASCERSIPLENTGGAGTADVHWRRSVFANELMVAYVAAAGTAMPVSTLTIGALADLGYVTNAKAADPYMVPSTAASAVRSEARRTARGANEPRLGENLLAPRFSVAPNGRVRMLQQRFLK
jgi:hypothetical protein